MQINSSITELDLIEMFKTIFFSRTNISYCYTVYSND
jgi:hypothetical protein